jgi:hypothetical protein
LTRKKVYAKILVRDFLKERGRPMKKLLALLLILSLTVFAFASCTSPDNPDNPDDPDSGETGNPSEDGPNIDPNGWTNS